MIKKTTNVVVFDLDETLGHFSSLGLIWETLLVSCYKSNVNPPSFTSIMRLFPEYQRPGVLKILRYLLGKKEQNVCTSVMIYTNNQGPDSWANAICSYFESELGSKLFDRIIRAFKVRGKLIEPKRTSHEKNVSDLLSCTQLPANTEICFIDDQYHVSMENEKVFYIHIKPYTFTMPFQKVLDRLYEGGILSEYPLDTQRMIRSEISKLKNIYPEDDTQTSENEVIVDGAVSKRILQQLQSFFKEHGTRFSRRKATIKKNTKTRKSKN